LLDAKIGEAKDVPLKVHSKGAAMETHPLDPQEPERAALTAHEESVLLGRIAVEGPSGFFRVLWEGAHGSRAAALLHAGAAVRALPDMGALRGQELLARAHVPAEQPIGALEAAQRAELCRLVSAVSVAGQRPPR